MLITTNMGIQVDPIGLNNVNFIRYVRPNVSSIQRTRRCLFGRSNPEQNKRIYENTANNERNRCIERYGFDPVKSEFIKNCKVDNEETVNTATDCNEAVRAVNTTTDDNSEQQCLDNVVVAKQSSADDIVRASENINDLSTSESEKKDIDDAKDVIKYNKLHAMDDVHQGSRRQLIKRTHETEHKTTVSDYFPKKKKPTS